jgi:hypothetical protein
MMPGVDLELGFTGQQWRDEAACKDFTASTVSWFPVRGQDHRPAVLVCQLCTVSRSCLEFALGLPENPDGIWGGYTMQGRRRLRRG